MDNAVNDFFVDACGQAELKPSLELLDKDSQDIPDSISSMNASLYLLKKKTDLHIQGIKQMSN